jgi:KaiC/GvpD/RAD55 family RecA-like ATPase
MNFYDRFDKPEPVPPPAQPGRRPTDFYAARALDLEVENVETAAEGTRNHTLNIAAFNLGQFVAVGVLDEREVAGQLEAAALRAGLGQTETRNTIASGLKAGAEHPRVVQDRPRVDVPDVVTLPDAPDQVGEWIREYLPHIDWHELWAAEDDEQWIVEPILPARRLVALYSPPKVGKSLLALELAAAVATGRQVLGITPDRPRKVLYVDFENDPRGDVRERLQAMRYKPEDLDNLFYLSYPRLSMLDSEQGSEELLAAVKYYECDAVIIDTVSRVIAGKENENDTWLAFYRHTGKKLKAAEVACLRLDHSGKDETKGQRGGSAKSGDVDLVWRLSTVEADRVYRLDCEANRMPVAEKTLVLHRETGPLRHRVDAEGRRAVWRTKVDTIIRALDQAGAPRGTGERKARELLKSQGVTARTEVLREALKLRPFTMGAPDSADRAHPEWAQMGAGTPPDDKRRSEP